MDTIVDNHNNRDKSINDAECYKPQFCEEKYKSPECIEEYYTTKPVFDYYDKQNDRFIKDVTKRGKINISTTDLESTISVGITNFSPDTIYRHSELQPPVEFVCFIGGVIGLWTGFSVYSIYAYGKQVFSKKHNKIESSNSVNLTGIKWI